MAGSRPDIQCQLVVWYARSCDGRTQRKIYHNPKAMKTIKLLILILITSCSSDDPAPQIKFESDPILRPAVDQFYVDAARYGYELQKDNLKVIFTTHKEDQYWCPDKCHQYSTSYTKDNQRIIELDKSKLDGRYKSSVYREMAYILLHKPYIYTISTTSIHTEIMNIQYCPCEDDGTLWQNALDKLFN